MKKDYRFFHRNALATNTKKNTRVMFCLRGANYPHTLARDFRFTWYIKHSRSCLSITTSQWVMHHMPNNLTSWFSTLKTFITDNYWLLVLIFVVRGWLDFRRFNIWVALISCQNIRGTEGWVEVRIWWGKVKWQFVTGEFWTYFSTYDYLFSREAFSWLTKRRQLYDMLGNLVHLNEVW